MTNPDQPYTPAPREVSLSHIRSGYATAWWDDYSLTDLDEPAGIRATERYLAEFDRALATFRAEVEAQLRAHIAAEIRAMPSATASRSLTLEDAAQIAEGTK